MPDSELRQRRSKASQIQADAEVKQPFGSRARAHKPARARPCKAACGLMLASPSLIGFSIRLADIFLFDVRLNTMGLTPAIVFSLNATLSLFLLWLSSRRPIVGATLSTLLFSLAKMHADNLEAPLLSCGGFRCVSIITGANSGIGLAVAKTLAAQGHEVVLGCRGEADCDRASAAVARHAAANHAANSGLARVHAAPLLDLGSVAAVKAWAATSMPASVKQVDYLINNAGFVPVGNGKLPASHLPGALPNSLPLTVHLRSLSTCHLHGAAATTTDGLEASFGISHVGHYALVRELRRSGVLGTAATVVQVSSDAARLGAFHTSILHGGGSGGEAGGKGTGGEGDLRGEHTTGCASAFPFCVPPARNADMHKATAGPYNFGAYPRAKLSNVLFARQLASSSAAGVSAAAGSDGSALTGRLFTSSVHPGTVYTRLAEQVAQPFAKIGGVRIQTDAMQAATMRCFLRPPLAAAVVVLRAAAAARHRPGTFCNGMGEPVPDKLLPAVMKDDELAARLWEVTERLVRQHEERAESE